MKTKTCLIAFLLTLFLASAGLSKAQSYNQAIGIRGGVFTGVTYKQFVSGSNSIELLGAVRNDGHLVQVAGVYQWTFMIEPVPELSWHVGPGVHSNLGLHESETVITLGANANVGIEYDFPGVPFTVGLDYNLMVNLVGDTGMQYNGIGIAFRYTW